MDSCVWYTPLRRLLEGNFLCKTKKKKKKNVSVLEFFKPLPRNKKGMLPTEKKKRNVC